MTAALHGAFKAYDVRGVVGRDIDEAGFRAVGTALAETLHETGAPLLIGHDMRESSPGLARAMAQGAAAAGIDVVVLGLCSTDQLYFASGDMRAPGVMITASHNPAGYNGMKVCRAGARPVSLDTGLDVIRDRAVQLLGGGDPPAPVAAAGTVRETDCLARYARHLRGLVPLTAGRRLRVVVDAGNGMAGLTAPAVLGTGAGLEPLPVELIGLFLDLDGTFPNHEANPLEPANLRDLQAAVVSHGADIGLAFDGDADRCFVVDERGGAVDPSAVTALVARREIARARAGGEAEPTVLYNLITSRIVPEVVAADGALAVRTRVGHSYIKAEMARLGAVFGGEHSAHYYFRDFYGADSGMLAAMHVLAALGEAAPGTALSSLVAPYRRYARSGELNTAVADPLAAMAAAVEHLQRTRAEPLELDRMDGVTVSARTWWVNIRPSNTEPLLRLNVEAADEPTMTDLRDDVLGMLRGRTGAHR